jgi:hypothetical protein
VNRAGIPVLRILDQEDDEKCDDSRRGIDNELPGIGVVEVRARHEPQHDDSESGEERPFRPNSIGPTRGENVKALFIAIPNRHVLMGIAVASRKKGNIPDLRTLQSIEGVQTAASSQCAGAPG